MRNHRPPDVGGGGNVLNGYGRGEEKSKDKASVITRETFGMTILLFSIALLAISAFGSYMLGEIGVAITAFLMGIFGYFIYPFLVFCVLLSLRMISGRKGFAGKRVLLTMAVLVSVFLVVHLATSARYLGGGFGEYLGGCWNAASASVADATGGGVVFGIIVWPVQALLSKVGAYLVFSLLIALAAFFFLWASPIREKLKKERAPRGQTVEKATPKPVQPPKEEPAPRYAQPSEQPYAQQPRYEEPRYEQPRYEQPRYEQPRYEQPRYEQPRYEQPQSRGFHGHPLWHRSRGQLPQ